MPAPTAPESIGWLLLSIFALLGGANQTVSLWHKLFRPTGAEAMHEGGKLYQPRGDYVTRAEFSGKMTEISGELEGIRKEM
ncbi:MAG: hypothetical protein KIT22_14685, partial [Verrucomicrobiae bacterium]|nr:hypothetical protein [Verrucomicrobiae bacterium]